MTPRLQTSIWASALLRRAQSGGAYAALLKRGDKDAGSVLIKVSRLDGTAALYQPILGKDGNRAFLEKSATEKEIDADIRKYLVGDPDMWVCEIEDRTGRHFLTEPIERL